MLAIDILRWPGVNQAFLFSFALTLAMSYVIVLVGKRRPVDRKATWGEAIFGATYVFAVMFIAFGVVPHQFIDHADKNLGWRKDNIIFGPFDILKPKSLRDSCKVSSLYLTPSSAYSKAKASLLPKFAR